MSAQALFLLVRLGEDCFAIDADNVVEVVPLVRLKVVPRAPVGSAGIMSYRGDVVPVVDLNILALGVASPSRLMTRIVIVRIDDERSARGMRLLGLLVPEVMRTSHFDPTRFVSVGLATEGERYLGGVLLTDEGVIQRVRLSALLSDELRDALVSPTAAA